MKIDVIVGLNYGSEAKGLVASQIALNGRYDACITSNSCQSGHTSYFNKNGDMIKIVNRQLPSSFPYCNTVIIGPGALIKPSVLEQEVKELESHGFNIRGKLYIDRNACVIPDDAGEKEKELVKEIGSTGEGVGYAMSERVWRRAELVSDHSDFFSHFGKIMDTHYILKAKNRILVEGSQGFGLSLIHGHYPHVTSRDTSVQSLLAYAGLPINKVDKIIGVARTFPIRVGSVVKTSGPMNEEIDWKTLAEECGAPEDITERTTVTGRVRRVSRFDFAEFEKAVWVNGVSHVALTFLNYLDWSITEKDYHEHIQYPDKVRNFIKEIGKYAKVGYISYDKYRCVPYNG